MTAHKPRRVARTQHRFDGLLISLFFETLSAHVIQSAMAVPKVERSEFSAEKRWISE